ncbi:MAG: alpha/beta hydrolase [Rikenellaceae bacterium]|nr:alpha/beta hydrolase [Rikenellaceae bacterium]
MKEEQVLIREEPQLFGMVYSPEVANGRGVLMIHPFGEERKSSVRILVMMAKALCREGFSVMLFDLCGHGDSSYDMEEGGICAWMEDIRDAAAYLCRLSGMDRVSLVGLRFGSYLASLFASQSENIERLILLEPVTEPTKYLRKSLRSKLVKELITVGAISSNRAQLISGLKNDITVDFDGYAITGNFYKELEKYETDHIFGDLGKNTRPVSVVTMTRSSRNAIISLDLTSRFPDTVIGHIEAPAFWEKIDYTPLDELNSLIVEILSNA